MAAPSVGAHRPAGPRPAAHHAHVGLRLQVAGAAPLENGLLAPEQDSDAGLRTAWLDIDRPERLAASLGAALARLL